MVEKHHSIYPNVYLGDDTQIGEYVVIGIAPKGFKAGELVTRIGAYGHIRSHTVIYAGNVIGARFQTGHNAMIREQNEIGDDVSVGTHTIVEHHVKIKDRVRIHSGAFIPEYSILEEDSWVGPNAVFTNARYPQSHDVKKTLKGPHIMPGAKIGANATILPGILIGHNSLVGAGAVVLNDIPDNKVATGNPARIVKDIREITAYDIRDLIGKGE